MSTSPPGSQDNALDAALLGEAAEWVMALHFGHPAKPDHQAFEHWRQQSAAHARAWEKAETVLSTFEQVPADIGRRAVQALQPGARRRTLQMLGALLVVAPAGWVAWKQAPWRHWTADAVTARGERKSLELADGTRLVLNTESAVEIAFSPIERRIRLLAGEILIATHTDPSPTYRPFLVLTPQGSVQALGTRFSVRRLDEASRVAVFEHAVRIRTRAGAGRAVHAGQQVDFSVERVEHPEAVADTAGLWERGMLLATNMRLADVIAELARYRSGVLRCDALVADLRVSGALSLADTDAALALLERTLPVRVERTARYWVTVSPRVDPEEPAKR